MGSSVVLDVGKTNAKLVAFDEAGRVQLELRRPSAVLAGPPYPSLDADGVFEWAVEGLARMAADRDVRAIVPVAHGAAAALVAGDALALPVLDYEFDGVGEFDAEYEPLARDFARTHSPRLPAGLNLGRQLFWLERVFPAEFARTTDILLCPQYFAWRLSGAKHAEPTSLGCHTDLWQPEARAFSRFARERGFAARFPPLVPAWTRVGAIRPELAHATGVREDCAVLAGVHDSNASYLAQLARRRDRFTVVSTGTWFVCLARGAKLERLRPDCDMLANVDVYGDPVATARFMGGRMHEALRARGLSAEAAAAELARETGRCLDRLGAEGELIVEGPFARDAAYCAALAALRAPQVVTRSADATGTLAGARILVEWSR